MILPYRPMRPSDVPECVEIISRHPTISPHYGSAISDLGEAWLRLLGSESMVTAVQEAVDGTGSRICFVGVSVIVTDAFIRELKATPMPWACAELVRRTIGGDPPLLTEKQLRRCNSYEGGGLNALGWEGCIRHEFEGQTEIYHGIMHAFTQLHRGFYWKELIAAHVESSQRLRWALSTGGLLWNPNEGQYDDRVDDIEAAIQRPHLLGVTREIETSRPGSWVGGLFKYRPPRCGFSRSEQQVLATALNGATDEEVSDLLGVSLPSGIL